MNLEEEITTFLKNSPIANIALASKELFHSNFLGWMFQKHPVTLNALINQINGEELPSNAGIKVYREKQHLDLVIEIGEDQLLIIENKVKSLPDKSQLERYAEKAEKIAKGRTFEKVYKIILTLTPNDWSRVTDKPQGWYGANYENLGRSLSRLALSGQNPYEFGMIRDYANFVTILSHIAQDESNDIWNQAGSQLEEKEFRVWLKEHKLHDLFGKRQGQYVAWKVYDALRQDLGSRILSRRSNKDLKPGEVNVYSAFSNSQPLVGVHFALPDTFCPDEETPVGVGFQVQGTQFRSFIEWANPGALSDRTADIASRVFTDSNCPPTFWTPNKASEGKFDQCKFDTRFHYRYTHLETPKSLQLNALATHLTEKARDLVGSLPEMECILSRHGKS